MDAYEGQAPNPDRPQNPFLPTTVPDWIPSPGFRGASKSSIRNQAQPIPPKTMERHVPSMALEHGKDTFSVGKGSGAAAPTSSMSPVVSPQSIKRKQIPTAPRKVVSNGGPHQISNTRDKVAGSSQRHVGSGVIETGFPPPPRRVPAPQSSDDDASRPTLPPRRGLEGDSVNLMDMEDDDVSNTALISPLRPS